MGSWSRLLVSALLALPLLAGGPEGAVLEYRVRIRPQGASVEQAGGFRLLTGPPLVSHNRVQRSRLGPWRIEPLAGEPADPALLVRELGFCYFSGPPAGAVALNEWIRIGNRRCRLWQVPTPPGLGVYAYLAEVAPNLLALAYLTASLGQGDLSSLEVHLARVELGPRTVPAADGTALLRTLHRLAEAPPAAGDDADPSALATEAVE
jgi:hypothetical protein